MLQYIINDTNIWIDLKLTGLIEKVFDLPFVICVPDILFHEELEREQDILYKNGLQVIEMTFEELTEASDIENKETGVSFNDVATLVLAKNKEYILITGDALLRKLALKYKVNVRGTLWLLDEMVSHKIITFKERSNVCLKLKNSTRRLPITELDKRIHNRE